MGVIYQIGEYWFYMREVDTLKQVFQFSFFYYAVLDTLA